MKVRSVFSLFDMFAAATVCLCLAVLSGCGGGGGGSAASTGVQDSAAQVTVTGSSAYAARTMAAAEAGPSGVELTAPGVSLRISLPATQTVTVSERFYFSGFPGGVVGVVIDIKPDGLDLSAAPARLCMSVADSGLDGDQLAIYTGDALDQQLDSTYNAADSTVCAQLVHTSPYGVRMAQRIPLTEYTIFGNLDVKGKYIYKFDTTSGEDSAQGSYVKYRVHVDCSGDCMADGDRYFTFIRGGDHDGELLIRDNGTYMLWKDVSNMKWLKLRTSAGGVEAGIAYYLAAHYVDYFSPGASGVSDSVFDPPQNLVQKFIDHDPDTSGYSRFISIARDAGKITVKVSNDGSSERVFTVEESTGRITKKGYNAGVPYTESALPSESAYTALRDDLLLYVNEILGYDDTPDYVAGQTYDEFIRMTPNQELFCINVRDLITGRGWGNIEAIEKYYRDRLRKMKGF